MTLDSMKFHIRVKDKEGIKDPKFSLKMRFGILSPFSEKQIAFI
jgi:hypothetical protein